jgi:threonine dehydratase
VGRPQRRRARDRGAPGRSGCLLRLTPLEPAPDAIARGRELWLKREDLHELGSFKWRGASPVVERLAAAGHAGVVTASTGNHGAATAWAASRAGMRAIVFVPAVATEAKLERLRAWGGELRVTDGDFDDSKDAARAFAAAAGLPFFEDGAEPLQYEGYGVIGTEIVVQCPQARAVVIPIGNGALAAGVGAVVDARSRGTLRLGVVAKEMPVMARSFAAGRPVEVGFGTTIADGLAVRVAIPRAVSRLLHAVDRIVEASERAIATALVTAADAGLVIEPAAAAGLAAVAELDLDGPIVAVITGRNVDAALIARARRDPSSFPA